MEGVKLKVVHAADPNYMRTMERAIRVGEPVLLQVKQNHIICAICTYDKFNCIL